jgi:hypothetical protein
MLVMLRQADRSTLQGNLRKVKFFLMRAAICTHALSPHELIMWAHGMVALISVCHILVEHRDCLLMQMKIRLQWQLKMMKLTFFITPLGGMSELFLEKLASL